MVLKKNFLFCFLGEVPASSDEETTSSPPSQSATPSTQNLDISATTASWNQNNVFARVRDSILVDNKSDEKSNTFLALILAAFLFAITIGVVVGVYLADARFVTPVKSHCMVTHTAGGSRSR